MPPSLVDLLRLALWLALLAAVFVPVERAFALHRAPLFRPEWFTDLGYYFVNGLVPTMMLSLPLAALAVGSAWLLPEAWTGFVAGWPMWLRVLAALVVADIGSYWAHRWSHEIPLLWRFHRIHHSAEHVDWLVNSRGHPFDFVFTRLFGLVPVYALGLGGGQPGTDGLLLALVTVVGTVWTFFIHANIRWRLGPLEALVSTPAFHHWHHTRERAHIDRNYAALFPVIDRLFGTHYLPRRWPASYGIPEPVPKGLARQLSAPFRPAAEVPAAKRG